MFAQEHDFQLAEELILAAVECIRAYARSDGRAVTYWGRRLDHWSNAMALSLDLRSRPDSQLQLLKEGADQGGTQQV